MEYKKVIPQGNYILLHYAAVKVNKLIVTPETGKTSIRAIVVQSGNKVNKVIHELSLVLISKTADITRCSSRMFLCKESDIIAINRNGLWYPVGNTVLVKRDNNERKTDGGIVIPAAYNTTDQSYFAFYIRYGFGAKSELQLSHGDRIHLSKKELWKNNEQNFQEIRIDGEDYLIVTSKSVEYKETL